MKRERVERPKKKREEQQEANVPIQRSGNAEATASELDSILDEIDEVLEENAEEFVKGYIQKGGQ